jgi:mRNA interferase HigB
MEGTRESGRLIFGSKAGAFCFQIENFLLNLCVTKYNLKNIIAVRNLVLFYLKHPDAKASIETWLAITKNASWQKPSDVVASFPDADPVKNNRVVFNITRNKYRLVAQISYERQWVFIKFIGTHAAYDKIDASTIEQF